MIQRAIADRLLTLSRQFPALTLTGPRQSGKTTVCRVLFDERPYANLELPDRRSLAVEDPRGFLADFPEGGVIDEVQRAPELLSYLQDDIDDHPDSTGRWILTGSQNLLLLEGVSQTLAGRTALTNLLPFGLSEIRKAGSDPGGLEQIILAGGFPALHVGTVDHTSWFESYLATYVERDVRQVQRVVDLVEFERFMGLCAGRSGQLLNIASLASDAGIRQETAKAWLAVLETCFVVHRLPPFFGNLNKRLIKRPKLYFVDTGLLCHLLGIRTPAQLRQHPLRGEVFETWVVSELMKMQSNHGLPWRVSFYRDRHGSEVDLVIEEGNRLILAEVKAGKTFQTEMARSVRVVRRALGPGTPVEELVVFAGEEGQRRSDLTVLSWRELEQGPWMSAWTGEG